jgi:protocatechuate 3,4-dioxygenase beta subunit
MLMNSLSRPTRRRFLLNTGMLAAGSELSCADVVLSQELAPTPSCHDGNEPTVRETEGPFFKPRSPERSDLREPGAEGSPFELSGFVLTRSCRPLSAAVVDLWHADDKGEYDDIVAMSSPGPTARSVFAPSSRRSTPAARGTITSRSKHRAAVY